MSYFPPQILSGSSLVGNPYNTPGYPISVSTDGTLTLSAGTIFDTIVSGRTTTGNISLTASDNGTSLRSTDATPVIYTLPAGLAGGFKARSYQGGAGTITYSAGAGASILNGTQTSGGIITAAAGYYADMENLGNNVWVITGVL